MNDHWERVITTLLALIFLAITVGVWQDRWQFTNVRGIPLMGNRWTGEVWRVSEEKMHLYETNERVEEKPAKAHHEVPHVTAPPTGGTGSTQSRSTYVNPFRGGPR